MGLQTETPRFRPVCARRTDRPMNAGLGGTQARFAGKGIFSDPKRLHYFLFRIFYLEDLFDTACRRWPRLMRLFWWRIDPRLMNHKLLLIHVPRAGGTSVAHALY